MLSARLRSLLSSLMFVATPLTTACGGDDEGMTGFGEGSGNTDPTGDGSETGDESSTGSSDADGEGSGSGQSNTGSSSSTTDSGSETATDGSGETGESGTTGESGETATEGGEETGESGSEGETDTSGTGESGSTDDTGETSETSGSATDGGSEDTGATGDTSATDGTDETTSTSSSTSTSSTTSSGETGVEPCQVETTEVTPIPPNIMLVLDKSGSMSLSDWDHDSDGNTPNEDRWVTLHRVVDNLLTTWESDVKFGVKLYPAASIVSNSNNQGNCVVDPVEVECALDNGTAILASMPEANDTVYGRTPMEAGISLASTYLQTLSVSEPRVMILVADGEISTECTGQTFADAEQLVIDAAALGIPTYVVGIDAAGTTEDQLNDLAIGGGKPDPDGPESYYQTQNQADLDDAMQSIINDTLSCAITIDPLPNFPDLFEVWINDTEVPMVADCNTENGWVWTQQYSEIELCGTACDDLRTYGAMESRYYCEPG